LIFSSPLSGSFQPRAVQKPNRIYSSDYNIHPPKNKRLADNFSINHQKVQKQRRQRRVTLQASKLTEKLGRK
jgi:hypothetical protein